MILTFVLYVIYYAVWVLTSPFRLFSDVSVDTGIGGAISTATQYIATWNNILPLSTILACFSIIIGVELILASYKIVMWVIRRLPTQS